MELIKKVLNLDEVDLTKLILIDCTSTVYIFITWFLVDNIRMANFPLYLGINNSTNITEKIG